MAFSILIDGRAIEDIQEAINYYDEIEPGLGTKFENNLYRRMMVLRENPFFQIRYDNVHCLPMRNYPFMIHYTVDETQKRVIIRSVFNTYRNPENL